MKNTNYSIPLEWIIKWGRAYITKVVAKDGLFCDKALIVAEALDEMINDWKEENETD